MSTFAGKRILVLEDEPLISFAIEDMLEELGCEVAGIAHRVEPALALVAERTLDAAVLDVNIDGELSYRVADALAERDVPYMFATGYGESRHPGAHVHAPTLVKPYSIEALAGALQKLVG